MSSKLGESFEKELKEIEKQMRDLEKSHSEELTRHNKMKHDVDNSLKAPGLTDKRKGELEKMKRFFKLEDERFENQYKKQKQKLQQDKEKLLKKATHKGSKL